MSASSSTIVETDIPARLDRLPWSRFHTLVVVALGVTWILDGLEVTLAGTVAGALKTSPVLQFSNADVGLAGSAYLAGAVLGAIFFGWLTDRLGRKKLFFITLTVYLLATAATAFSWNLLELPALPLHHRRGHRRRVRGDQFHHPGAGAGARARLDRPLHQRLVLDRGSARRARRDRAARPGRIDPEHRLARRVPDRRGCSALVIFFMRLWLPESPRWLMTHGRADEAEKIVADIEARVRAEGHVIPDTPLPKVRLQTRTHTPLADVVHTLVHVHRTRALVALALMVAQAFFYNAIFFTYALVLTTFYGIPNEHVGWYILPFAAGNVLGPILLGRLFDTIGRRPMIAFTYLMSGLLLALTGWLFAQGMLSAREQTMAWSVIFFFASAAASSAYLTVSETFPLEIRALAIAVFYAVGTAIGGVIGPMLFGALIDSGSRASLFGGYLLGALLMVVAAGVMWRWGVAAERKPLEEVARPLAFRD